MNLLQATNRVLKRARLIQGETGELSSLTSSQFQNDVDIVIDAWNETIRYVYGHDDISKSFPYDTAEGTITLVAGTREYSLASDFEIMSYEILTDRTNGYQIFKYPGGYKALLGYQNIPSQFTGRPHYWCINPVNGNLRFDNEPTSSEAGEIYTYLYQKRLVFDDATDDFPFSDSVAEELIPAVLNIWRRDAKVREFDVDAFNIAVSQAVQKLSNSEIRSHW